MLFHRGDFITIFEITSFNSNLNKDLKMSTKKVENVTAVDEIKVATFKKLFGDDEAMHQLASIESITKFRQDNPRNFYVFGIPRTHLVCNFQTLPQAVIDGKVGAFEAMNITGKQGEFVLFQVAIFSPSQAIRNLSYRSTFEISCLNLEGVNYLGEEFNKRINVLSNSIQVLYFGMKIPEDFSGKATGKLKILSDNFAPQELQLTLDIGKGKVFNQGEDDENSLARISWLNSKIGQDDTVFAPFIPLKRIGQTIQLLGHTLTLNKNGLIAEISSTYHKMNTRVDGKAIPILHQPITFSCQDYSDKSHNLVADTFEFTKETNCEIAWLVIGSIDNQKVVINGSILFDGFIKYDINIIPEQTKCYKNFNLQVNYATDKFFVGLNRHGGLTPDRLDWVWCQNKWQDRYFIGNANGGATLRLCDQNSNTPLLNCYYNFRKMTLPTFWDNDSQGGVTLKKFDTHTQIDHFTGEIDLISNNLINFGFELQITPFRTIDSQRHLSEHFYQPNMHACVIGEDDIVEFCGFEKLRQDGVNCINIHHAVSMNPIINYPYSSLSFERLKDFVAKAHAENFKVSLYYTIRELTISAPEFWVFVGLGEEILVQGLGQEARPCTSVMGPHEYLIKNLPNNFLSAWAEVIKSGKAAGLLDLAVETNPLSRLENFYIEGLRYILERCPIDGLYLDDSCLSRQGFQRVWRIFNQFGNANPIIDYHAWNSFSFERNREFGSISNVLRDFHIMPYFSRLWFGEGFSYNAASREYQFTEISGIPFGLMGEMLQSGGNLYRGMLDGMTNRFGWHGDPRNIWKFFQDFDFPNCEIYSDIEYPELFTISNPDIRATLFKNTSGEYILSIASFALTTSKFTIELNDKSIAFDTFVAEDIPEFQNAFSLSKNQIFEVEAQKGYLLKLK